MATALGSEFRDTYLKLARGLSFKEFEQECHTVGKMARSHQFWISDLIAFGEEKFGEEAYQALDELGYGEWTLTTIARVGRQVPKERRRSGVSFAHHRLVAPLDPAQQIEWLRKAEKETLSLTKFRKALQEAGLIKMRARAKPREDNLWLQVRQALDLLKAARERIGEGEPWTEQQVEELIEALEKALFREEARDHA